MAQKKTAKHTTKKKPSTALAVRRKASVLPAQRPTADKLATTDVRSLTTDIALGELGLVEIKLTAKEEAVLNEPVDERQIRIKPTKHPQIYLPHQAYTRWMNRAFGRTGWSLIPASKPMLNGSSVICPYVLHIHGKPVAFAMGEQEYYANNKEQTYGDALESTVASALRRCMKRLGVGLELWDKDYIDGFLHRYGRKARVERTHEGELRQEEQWTRRDEPLPNEVQGRQRQAPPPEAPSTHHAGSDEPITQPQRRRLFAIIKHSSRSEQDVRDWLHTRWGWTSTGQITRRHYEYITSCIESPAPLPIPQGSR